MTAEELKECFPWLGTEEPASGADTIERLALWYSQLLQPGNYGVPTFNTDGEMLCPACGVTAEPCLSEGGYFIRHYLESVEGQIIHARGGGSEDFTDGSGEYILGCWECGAEFPVPSNMEVSWT